MDRGIRGCVTTDVHAERQRWIARTASELVQDLKYGIRLIAGNRTFSIVAILTLAVAIGGNTAIFSIVNGVVLKPLAVSEPDRLVRIYPGREPDIQAERHRPSSNAPMFSPTHASARHRAQPSRPARFRCSSLATSSTATTSRSWARKRESAGRSFSRRHTKRPRGLERRRSPNTVRRPTRQSSAACSRWMAGNGGHRRHAGRFRGVAPPLLARDFWVPLEDAPDLRDRSAHGSKLSDRLRPGVSRTQASAALKIAATQLRAEYQNVPEASNRCACVRLMVSKPFRALRARSCQCWCSSALMGIAATVVLLVACANLAGLLMGRAVAVRAEVAVRVALGAGRARLVRQLLTESLLLAMLGAIAGVGSRSGRCSSSTSPPSQLPFPVEFDFSLDRRVLVYAIGLSVLTALAFGTAPARAAARIDLVAALKDEGTGIMQRQRFRRSWSMTQVAACTTLLLWSGLFLRSLARVGQVNPGFDPNGVLLASVTLIRQSASHAAADGTLFRTLQEQVMALPGVEAAGMSWAVPLTLMSRESFSVFQETDPRGFARHPGGRKPADARLVCGDSHSLHCRP